MLTTVIGSRQSRRTSFARSCSSRDVGTVSSAICVVWGSRPRSCLTRYLGGLSLHLHTFCDEREQEERQMWRPALMPSHGPAHPD